MQRCRRPSEPRVWPCKFCGWIIDYLVMISSAWARSNRCVPVLVVFTAIPCCRLNYEALPNTTGGGDNNAGRASVGTSAYPQAGASSSGTAQTGTAAGWVARYGTGATGQSGGAAAIDVGGTTGVHGGGATTGVDSSFGGLGVGGVTVALHGGTTGVAGTVGGAGAAARAPGGGATAAAGSATVPQAGAPGVSELVLTGFMATTRHGGTTTTPYSDTCPGNEALIGLRGTVGNVGVTLVSSIQGICGVLLVNAGDPSIATSFETDLPVRGGTGSAWEQSCPAGQVVIGFAGNAGSGLDSVSVRCGSLAVQGSSIGVTAGATLPEAGGNGGTPFTDGCSSGQVARGLNLIVNDGHWVDALGMTCGLPMLATP